MKKLWITLTGLALLVLPNVASAAFNQQQIIDDDAFINVGAMTGTAVQNFLASKSSVLSGYQEGGRSAASIITDAARAHNINPQVLLANLQKEQGLITLTSYDTGSDPSSRLKYAMGYACPDSGGCDQKYAGFTKQVDGAAFQLRYNFDGSTTKKFADYQVNQTMTFDGTSVTLLNRATAALYRYTPHISGNKSFYNSFFTYFLEYSSHWGSQNAFPTLAPGDSYRFSVGFDNIGNKPWDQSTTRLGTDRPKDRISSFLRENRINGDETRWSTSNRIAMRQASVPVGGSGTFDFYMTVPNGMGPGTYREYFRPLIEGQTWMDDDQVYWDITVANHQSAWAGQSAGRQEVEVGQPMQFSVSLRNTGTTTWRNSGQTPVRLGTSRNRDRLPIFLREDTVNKSPSGWATPNRIEMVESTVAPGGTGTFRFWYTVPSSVPPGTYREYFQPVHENVRWMEDLGIYFDIVVVPPKALYLNQSSYPTLSKGESAQFTVRFQNTGSATWSRGGSTPMQLGTLRSQDRVPKFIRDDAVGRNPSGWATVSRVAMVEESVPPGGTGTFTFWYTVPGDKAPGVYREHFGLVQEGYAWLPDQGLFWDVTVK